MAQSEVKESGSKEEAMLAGRYSWSEGKPVASHGQFDWVLTLW